jgi:glycerate 2-kinase
MKIIIAPQAFKGTLSPFAAARAIELGVKQIFPEASSLLMPVADGGDGTLEVLVNAKHGLLHPATPKDPFGNDIATYWGALPDNITAIIEIARICGLAKTSLNQLNPMITSSYGVGEVILTALESGFRRFVIGIGGSVTNDAGAGLAQALGARLLDKHGRDIPRGGGALANLHKIDKSKMDSRLKECEFLIACDVLNPIIGSEGATKIFASQKGASPEMIEHLENALKNFTEVAQRDLGIEMGCLPGGGAAGGMGAGLAAFLGASLRPGIGLILELLNFEHHLKNAHLVITGEGCLEKQTLYNKAPFGVAQAARKHGIPVIAVVGTVDKGYHGIHRNGVDAVMPTSFAPMKIPSDITSAQDFLTQATEQALRCIRVGMSLKI